MGVATRTTASVDGSFTTEIVLAIATARGVDPTELHPPLSDAVDPDALDRLLGHGGDTTVEFTYDGLTVTVVADGAIIIADADGGD